ncbi:MAG: iron ABC transporter permease [Burkholderiales bacterium PBB4]|nr:MAG: iron ABC transporter permease [Burkholderiales bacterium PBB4]
MVPVLAVFASWGLGSGELASWALLTEMAQTVLPDYVVTTLVLCGAVALGVVAVGLGAAMAVTLFDFPGRRWLEWALLLPLAMPAYVIAYAYTDFLQFSGPLQTGVRAAMGVEGRVFPEVRNVVGAAWVFTFALYPYVYLLARTALSERASHLLEAARLMGAPLGRRVREVALPLARPAVAAGVALALMETLADFGVSSYFGIQTFTAGIYKAWLSMDNKIAAAQLATLLLVLVAVLLKLEHRAQARMRFSGLKGGRPQGQDAAATRLSPSAYWLAWLACGVPVLMGFVFPVLFMVRPLMLEGAEIPWARFGEWAWNSVRLGALTGVLAVLLAVLLAFNVRRSRHWSARFVVQLTGLGYAIPGAVVVVGLLLPVGWVQQWQPQWQIGYWVTATVLGLLWAYLVRFSSVALQSIQSGYSRIPLSLDESARMLGAGSGQLLGQVHWPLLRRSVAAAALLVFVDVMKELPVTLVLRPFNNDTLAVVAYQLARDERLGEAALPCLALVLVGLLPVILLSRTLRSHR